MDFIPKLIRALALFPTALGNLNYKIVWPLSVIV